MTHCCDSQQAEGHLSRHPHILTARSRLMGAEQSHESSLEERVCGWLGLTEPNLGWIPAFMTGAGASSNSTIRSMFIYNLVSAFQKHRRAYLYREGFEPCKSLTDWPLPT